jgi:CRP-like cAMP-binding protein
MTKVNSVDALAGDEACLRSLALFADVSASDLKLLAHHSCRVVWDAEQFLFHEGKPAQAYYLVQQGGVEVLRFGLDGEDRIFNVFGVGQLVAIAAMFMPHGLYPMSARARGETVCVRLSREPLLQVCRQTPMLAMRMLAMLSSTVYQRVNEVEWLVASSASQRLALYLLKACPASDEVSAAETLSRLLADWQARGVVAGRGREWRIVNRRYLQQLSSAAQRTF